MLVNFLICLNNQLKRIQRDERQKEFSPIEYIF